MVTPASTSTLAAVARSAATRSGVVAPGSAHAAARVASPELAAIPGIDDLARVVGQPHSALDDAARGVLESVVGPIAARPWADQPRMPLDATADALLSAAGLRSGPDAVYMKSAAARQHALDAWAARLSIDERDQAAIRDELVGMLDAGPAASYDDVAARARLQVLAHLDRDGHAVPRELGFSSASEVSEMFGPGGLDASISRDRRFFEELATLVVPARRARWDAAVERAVAATDPRDVGTLGARATLEMVVSDAAGWSNRSAAERLRLLDALTGPFDAPSTAISHARSTFNRPSVRTYPELADHVALQLDRMLADEAAFPARADVYDLVSSTGWIDRPAAERAAVLDAAAESFGEPALVAMRRDAGWFIIERKLGDGDLAHMRARADELLDPIIRGEVDELPTWLHAADVVASTRSADELAPVLRLLAARSGAETPDGAAAWLLGVRDRIADASTAERRDPSVRAIATDALQLVDHNLARIQRTPFAAGGDGYAGWPDLAEVGRVRATVDLLDQLDHNPSVARGEVLAW